MESSDVIRLESGMSVAAALSRLGQGSADSVALVHRRESDGDVWYRLDPKRLSAQLSTAHPDETIGSIVTLDALNRVPVIDLRDVEDPGAVSGVLTIGSEVVGFRDGPGDTGGFTERRRRGVSDVLVGAAPGGPAHVDGGAAGGSFDDGMVVPGSPIGEPPAPVTPGRPTSLTTHGEIEAPEVVGLGERFTVEISIAPDYGSGAAGGELFVPDIGPDADRIVLDVHLVGGFRVIGEQGGYAAIEVDTATGRGGPAVFELEATTPPPWYDPSVGVWIDRVMALFSHRGSPCGQLWKEVRVNVVGDHTTAVAARQMNTRSEATPIAPVSAHSQDLTIVLSRVGGVAAGSYLLTLHSRHFDHPYLPAPVDIGDDALGFASRLIRDVGQHVNDRTTYEVLLGIGSVVADLLPPSFWEALRTVWEKVAGAAVPIEQRRPPVVLLMTDDPYVPWELAVPPEPLDPGAPPFLAAQLDVGRWPLDVGSMPDSSSLSTAALGVVIGHYEDARGVRPLPSAVAEGEALVGRFRARAVDASDVFLDQVLRGCFDDGFAFEGLHFAGHGVNDPERHGAYLTLSNGRPLSEFVFRAPEVAAAGRAFLFLNACQVGTANQTLGSYAGVAGLAVRAGFRGFLAPLWSVSDDLAKEVSVGFYEASSSGRTVAGYLREMRGHFDEGDSGSANASWLAYVYYGHPALTLGGPSTVEVAG